MEHAKRAMDWINLNTRMRCVFPKYDYTSRSDKADPGVPCPILHVSNLPFNATPGEFVKILSVYDGYRDVQFFRESCLVFFSSSEDVSQTAASEVVGGSNSLIRAPFSFYVRVNRPQELPVTLPKQRILSPCFPKRA